MRPLFLALIFISQMCGPAHALGSGKEGCQVGVFIADAPTRADIENFEKNFGRKPALVLLFIDWNRFIAAPVIDAISEEGISPVITWEPWFLPSKEGVNPDDILSGKYDEYIHDFAERLRPVKTTVYIRFAHEANGNWYPWSDQKTWGKGKYAAVYQYVRKVFERGGASRVRWIFSINAENVPSDNTYTQYYPGDEFVDYVGVDGYNWGITQSWSKWRSFEEIFIPIYRDVVKRYRKPVMVTEVATASKGGDKTRWIRQAMQALKRMKEIRAVIFFNQDKEADWGFSAGSHPAEEFRAGLTDPYFAR